VANLLTKTEEKVVALLHDSVEDTPVTLDDLRKSFSEVIVQAVDAMTKQE
jgi:(p)ppGpp synthase/HD superfamily hydrolase